MLKVLRKSIGHFILAMLAISAVAMVEGYTFILLMNLFDLALAKDMIRFKEVALEVVLYAVFLIPFTMIVSFTKGIYKKKAIICLKEYYIKGVYNKNISEFQKDNNANYISNLTNDFNTLELNLIDTSYDIGYCIINFVVGIWMMTRVNPWIIVLTIAVAGLNVGFSAIMSKPVAVHTKERSDLFEYYTGYVKEVLSAFQIIKSNNLVERVKDNFEQKSMDIQEKGYIIDRFLSFMYALQNATIYINYIAIMGVMGYLVVIGKATMGSVILIMQALEKVMMPLAMLSESIPKLFTVKELMKKIEEALRNHDTYEETLEVDTFKDTLKLKNVAFAYGEELVLKQVNLQLKRGGKYLITGPSGGGKSTLLKLLRKYFNPTEGVISLDDQDFKDIKKDTYFELVSNIEQQVFIFEDTLRNNITLYKNYSDEEIDEVVYKSGLREFVENLPNGLDTMVYENGKNISGGERSRVVIARGLLSKASIIFLDEAFASLDMEKAKAIEKNLLELKDVTIINVSHVIFEETKMQYDDIFVVKNGSVKALSA